MTKDERRALREPYEWKHKPAPDDLFPQFESHQRMEKIVINPVLYEMLIADDVMWANHYD